MRFTMLLIAIVFAAACAAPATILRPTLPPCALPVGDACASTD